jgi:hypothetical protein
VRHRNRPAEQIAVPTTLGLLTIAHDVLPQAFAVRRLLTPFLKFDALSSNGAMLVQVDP